MKIGYTQGLLSNAHVASAWASGRDALGLHETLWWCEKRRENSTKGDVCVCTF